MYGLEFEPWYFHYFTLKSEILVTRILDNTYIDIREI
jgi:hypothetical protein